MGGFLDKPITEKHTLALEETKIEGLRYSISSMQGWRVHMEDAHVHQIGLSLAGPSNPPLDIALFGVFDGHGGETIANEAATMIVGTFTGEFHKGMGKPGSLSDKLKHAMENAFLVMDERMKTIPKVMTGEDCSGCTATCALVTQEAYIVANAGDSRCIIVGPNGSVKFHSIDHKPDAADEMDRIQKAGGYVSMRRINGDLAVSRGLGDFVFKQNTDLPAKDQQVSPFPDVDVIPRSPEDLFLVLACDGIWDVMSNEDCGDFILRAYQAGHSLGQCAEALLDHCLEMNSRDNMSVVIVALPATHSLEKLSLYGEKKMSTISSGQSAQTSEKDSVDQARQQSPSKTQKLPGKDASKPGNDRKNSNR